MARDAVVLITQYPGYAVYITTWRASAAAWRTLPPAGVGALARALKDITGSTGSIRTR